MKDIATNHGNLNYEHIYVNIRVGNVNVWAVPHIRLFGTA